MSNLIVVGEDFNRGPGIPCPHCKKELHLRLDAFKPEIVKVVSAKCPFCGGENHAYIQILMASNLNDLNTLMQSIQDAMNEQGVPLHLIDQEGEIK